MHIVEIIIYDSLQLMFDHQYLQSGESIKMQCTLSQMVCACA